MLRIIKLRYLFYIRHTNIDNHFFIFLSMFIKLLSLLNYYIKNYYYIKKENIL